MACQKCEKTQVLTTWSFHRGGSTCARRAHDQRSVLLFWRTSSPPIKDSRLFTIYSWFILTITSTPTGHEFFEIFSAFFWKKPSSFVFDDHRSISLVWSDYDYCTAILKVSTVLAFDLFDSFQKIQKTKWLESMFEEVAFGIPWWQWSLWPPC